MKYRVVKSSNHDLDLYQEEWVGPPMPSHACEAIVKIINAQFPSDHPDYYRVVPEIYTLRTADPNV